MEAREPFGHLGGGGVDRQPVAGMADRERAIHIMNAARYFLPHVLALSTSSPFWMGHNTGLKSYRTEIFKQFPRTDITDHFDSYSSFQRYVELDQDGLCR